MAIGGNSVTKLMDVYSGQKSRKNILRNHLFGLIVRKEQTDVRLLDRYRASFGVKLAISIH